MTINYTGNLGLALPVQGTESGVWGDVVNAGITNLLDSAVAGTTTLSADADVTLTTTNGAANQARQAILLWTAGGTITRNITAPALSKAYIVINKTSSTQSIVLRGVGPTAGVTIINGEKAVCAWNGTDFVKVGSTVALPAGSTTQVQYNLSGVLTGSPNMTFNGTTLTAAGLAGPFNGSVGATTPSTGAFTTLSASSTVSGVGFSTYLASPPAIGGTTAAAGSFTTLAASSTVSGAGINNLFASPPAIGGTTRAAGSFTVLLVKPNSASTNYADMDTVGTGQEVALRYLSNGGLRWYTGKTALAESGANAGSDWFLARCSDAGAVLDLPISIARNTGVMSLTAAPTGAGINNLFATPPPMGATSPNSGNFSLVTVRTGTEGQVRLVTGGASNTGYVDFLCPTTFTRQGYIGYASTSGATDTGTLNYIAGTHAFAGGITATTQAIGTNSTQVATTAYADRAALTGATWQTVTGSRALGTSYTNSTGRFIVCNVDCVSSGATNMFVTIGGISMRGVPFTSSGVTAGMQFTVPPGATYSVSATSLTLNAWHELRT